MDRGECSRSILKKVDTDGHAAPSNSSTVIHRGGPDAHPYVLFTRPRRAVYLSGVGAHMALTPEQRSLRARMAAHALHAQTDSREHIRPAREAFLRRFEDQVDPDRQLTPEERDRRAHQALKAHMTALAFKSSTARARRSPKGPTRDSL